MKPNRKNEIFEAAIALFQKESFDRVTVKQICEQCGVTKKAFYYHYSSKDDLILDYYNNVRQKMRAFPRPEEGGADYREQIWAYLEYYIDSTLRLGSDLLKTLIRIDMDHGCRLFSPFTTGQYVGPVTYETSVVELVSRGQRAGQIRGDVPARDLLMSFSAALIGIAVHWSSSGGRYDEKAELRKQFDVILHP